MRIAVLIKQIPDIAQLRLQDGRLVRDGVPNEVSAFCRRANSKAVELSAPDGESVVFTMGPPAAEDALREMLACGATRAVHLCDPGFAGSDTVATARALAAAIRREGPFDLVLCGLNSLDADTGQVGPQVAELLELPFAPGVRELDVDGTLFRARLETEDGFRHVRGTLPAVLSTAERLCQPSKAEPDERAAIHADRITAVCPGDLSLPAGDIGAAGSPTRVGPPSPVDISRRRVLAGSAAEAVELLREWDAPTDSLPEVGPTVPATGGPGPGVWCFVESEQARTSHELVGAAADLAASLDGSVTVVTPQPAARGLAAYGADRVWQVPDAPEPEQWAHTLGVAADRHRPAVLLVEGTPKGRVVASRVAARHHWGLTGDAIDVELAPTGRLVAWKPAFGGKLVVPIQSSSPVQIATVRPGVLPARGSRPGATETVEQLTPPPPPQVTTTSVERLDDHAAELQRAEAVVGVGTGVDPQEYASLEPLRAALGNAQLAASRKVTDQGWMPRNRQVGITGMSIAPRLYVAVGVRGSFNHAVGFRGARTVLAINSDPEAPIFDHADVGVVGDWRALVPELARALRAVPPFDSPAFATAGHCRS